MKTIIHVNQHVIKSNAKNGEANPPLTVKTYKDNRRAHTAVIRTADGIEVARFVYSPDKPLACGARLWVETTLGVEVFDGPGASEGDSADLALF